MSANEIAVMFQNGSLEGTNIDIAVMLHLTSFKVAMKGRILVLGICNTMLL